MREISWSHNLAIFEKCKDDHERLFYIQQTRRNGWSKAVLIHQIESQSYQKTLISQQNFAQTLPESAQSHAVLALKDEYTFDFLNLADAHSEYELEQAILANIRKFLIEMGGDFTFRRGYLHPQRATPRQPQPVLPQPLRVRAPD